MKTLPCNSRFGMAPLAGAVLLLWGLSPLSAEPLAAGTCVATATKYKVSALLHQTNSTTFVEVAETTIAFTQGGSSKSCVIVSFSAQATAEQNTVMYVRARLDGNTDCLPNDNLFVGPSPTADHAMNYVCPNVAPGNHSIKIQFRSNSGPTVHMNRRTTLVHYVK